MNVPQLWLASRMSCKCKSLWSINFTFNNLIREVWILFPFFSQTKRLQDNSVPKFCKHALTVYFLRHVYLSSKSVPSDETWFPPFDERIIDYSMVSQTAGRQVLKNYLQYNCIPHSFTVCRNRYFTGHSESNCITSPSDITSPTDSSK
jgi:hypothetical protein